MTDDLILKLQQLIDNTPSKQLISSLRKHTEIYNYVINNTQFLPANVKVTERVYNILNPLIKPNCMLGNKKVFGTLSFGYKQFCGARSKCKCSRDNHSKKMKIKWDIMDVQTKKKRTDKSIRNLNTTKIKEKIKNTNLERYGVEKPFQSDKIRNKAKQTYKNKTGFNTPFENKEVIDNILQEQQFKYGGLMISAREALYTKYNGNPFGNTEIQKKIKKTNVERYGVEHAISDINIRNKVIKTNIMRYGVSCVLTNHEIINKIKKTNINRYGVENVFQSKIIYNKTKETQKHNFYRNIINRINNVAKPKFTYDEYCGVSYENKYSWKCNCCNNEFKDHLDDGHIPICRTCYPLRISAGETEVKLFLKSLNFNIIENNRTIIKPYELDIVIPSRNIAIEYNGLYWHSIKYRKNKSYHKMKLNMCNKAGYKLITIFEDEWLNKQDICKDRLNHILGVNNKTCYARQTTIKEISNKEHKYFLNKYHIQGFVGAKIKLGAYYNNELVAVMSFDMRRKALGNKTQKDNTYELLRFCTKDSIPGIGSKLFKYFTRKYKPTEIISYCDLRWGTGLFYEKLGFKLSHISKPNYWYTKDCLSRQHRYGFRKSALTEMVSYSKNKTEFEIMQEEGYYRIYDCGNKVFKWNMLTNVVSICH